MDGIFTEPPTGSGLSTFSSSKTSIVQSDEIVRYPFRKNIVITSPDGAIEAGSQAFTVTLDSLLDEAFLSNFEYWSIDNPTLDLQCTAPIGTASGAMMVAQFTDPLNADVPTDASLAFSKFGNTLGSVIIRPRDNKSLKIDITANALFGTWRFTKIDTANPRLSSFGVVSGIILESGAIGDGTTYTGWLTGHLLGKRRTNITGGIASQLFFKATLCGNSAPFISFVNEGWNLHHDIYMTNTSYGKDFPITNCPVILYLPKTLTLKLDITYKLNEDKYTINYDLPINTINGVSTEDGSSLSLLTPLPLLAKYPIDSDFSLTAVPPPTVFSAVIHFTYEADPFLLRVSLNHDSTFIPKNSGALRMTRSPKSHNHNPKKI